MDIFELSLIGLGCLLVFFVLVNIYIRLKAASFKYSEKYSVLTIRVPKESEIGPIAAEHLFSTLHGLTTKFSFWQKLKGYSSDTVSFEIAHVNGAIKFYVAFPERLRNLVEGQIYAQYPEIEMEDSEDYSYSTGKENALGVELNLIKSELYPIKRYPQFDNKSADVGFDPLAGITSSLVKFNNSEDQAWIQVSVTPLNDKWRKTFAKCLGFLKGGSLWGKLYVKIILSRKLWVKIVLFPIYFILLLVSLFVKPVNVEEQSNESKNITESITQKHEKETAVMASVDKISRLLFNCSIRIIYLPKDKANESSKIKLQEIAASFKQFNLPYLNGFEYKDYFFGKNIVKKYRKRIIDNSFVLNNEELATLYHLPNLSVKTPLIYWVSSKKLEPPRDLPDINSSESITILGKSNFRREKKVFGIKTSDRRRHVYIIGKTGMGKSTLLENMIYSDIVNGKGVGVIDPHGDLADSVLSFIPANRTNDVMLIEPFDTEYAVAFNMLENINPALSSIVCSGLVGIFKKLYVDSWGPRLEHILRNTILSLLEYPGTTMLGIIRILQDEDYRRKVVRKIQDPVVKTFWLSEFEKMQDKIRIEAISPILNKVGQFLSSHTIRNIVGQPKSTVNLRFAMDKGKIIIINLSKGKIGEDNSALLGSMFITKFQLDAMTRADVPEKDRKDFYLYVDEFQNFATEAFATILSEARKYKLNLTMANQYIAQMPDEVRDAVFGNVGSTLSFQVGFDDAEYLSQQYGEEILPSDLVSLSKYTAYMRLLIDGMPSKTFSMATLPSPNLTIDYERISTVRRVSNERYAEKISVVEDKIRRWSLNKIEEDEKNAEIENKVKETKVIDKKKTDVAEKSSIKKGTGKKRKSESK